MIGSVLIIDDKGVEKDSRKDFDILIVSKVISAPTPKFNKVDVPGRDGKIDLSDTITGEIKFDERQIYLKFRYMGPENKRTAMLTEFLNFAYGKQIKCIFSDDESYYYIGRMSSQRPEINKVVLDMEIDMIVEPYKRNIESTDDDWLWDPFDFELGVINELNNIIVNGSAEVSLVGADYTDNPIITVDSLMTVSYDGGDPINLSIGSHKIYDIIITKGTHTFVFTGNGIASISYRGGLL